MGGVVGGSLAFRACFPPVWARGACLSFAFRVAFALLARFGRDFPRVFAFGIFSIGQAQKVAKIGFISPCAFRACSRSEKRKKRQAVKLAVDFILLLFLNNAHKSARRLASNTCNRGSRRSLAY